MNSIKTSDLDEIIIDSLIEMIIECDDLIFSKEISDNLQKYKKKIIHTIINYDYVELIPKIKKIYLEDTNINNIIVENIVNLIHELNLSSLEWIITEESVIFANCLNKMDLSIIKNIIGSDNFLSIHELVKKNNEILNIFQCKIIVLLDCYIFMHKHHQNNLKFLKKFETIIILNDIYLKTKHLTKNHFDEVHSKIIFELLKLNNSFEIISKYIKYYKITDGDLKNFFEKNYILEKFIKFSSKEIIEWFFEIASIIVVIKPSNYKNIFMEASYSGDVELVKLTYNIIQCAGFNLDDTYLKYVLRKLIYNKRFSASLNNLRSTNFDKIIYELINIGIKPENIFSKSSNLNKYKEYYNNITILKK